MKSVFAMVSGFVVLESFSENLGFRTPLVNDGGTRIWWYIYIVCGDMFGKFVRALIA